MLRNILGQLQQLEGMLKSQPTNNELQNAVLQMQNSRKAVQGYMEGLEKESVMSIKREKEEAMREAVAADEKLNEKYGKVWDELAALQAEKAKALMPEGGGRPDVATFRELNEKEPALEKQIGEVAFALYGTDLAPWATSTYGWLGRSVEFGNEGEIALPPKLAATLPGIDPKTLVNWVCTCDIIGGNSGSPVIDKDLNVVGLVFDGNIESLSNNYVFTDDVARTVNVHTQIIIATLREVYAGVSVADELEKGTLPESK